MKFDSSGKWKFQRLAEAERAQSRKKKWGKRQKDTQKYGLDIGYSFDWLMSEQASSSEVASLAKKAIKRDRALQTATILNACLVNSTDGFYNANFSAIEQMDRPPTYGTNVFGPTHNHYVASGAAALTLATITAMKEHVKQHGYNRNLWGMMNTDMVKQVEDLAGWTGGTAANPVSGAIVDQVAIDGFAGRLLGINWKTTEWMPDNYLLLIAEPEGGGDKPLRYIQKKNPSAKGLILTPGSYDVKYPLINADYIHWLEALVVLRGAGVCYRIATTWTDPNVMTNVRE